MSSNDQDNFTSPPADVQMEDSDSISSLSDEDAADFRDANFVATPGYLPSQTASSLATPGSSQVPSNSVSTHISSLTFSDKDNGFDPNCPGLLVSNDIFSGDLSKVFHQQQGEFSCLIENGSIDPNSSHDLADFASTPSERKVGGRNPPGVGRSGTEDKVMQGKPGVTLILEDVQPQVVSRILDVLSEAQAEIKMKVVSQR